MSLAQETRVAVNISSENEVATYTNQDIHRLVIARITITGVYGGGGPYRGFAYVNDIEIIPNFLIEVDAGPTTIKMQSRIVLLKPGDILSMRVLGQTPDTDTTTFTVLSDVTPIRSSELSEEIIPDLINNLINQIETTISGIAVEVRPTRIVIGQCAKEVKPFQLPIRTTGVKQFKMPVRRCP